MTKNIKSISNPKLKLEILTPDEVRKIHSATLWIIEKVGIKFPRNERWISGRNTERMWTANGKL